MKKITWLYCSLLSLVWSTTVFATQPADLVEVFAAALASDPLYQQAIYQKLADKEGVPISFSALLPQLSALAAPTISRFLSSGPATINSTGTVKGYDFSVNLSQTIFDVGQLSEFASQQSLSKAADATLNAATQDLIIRTAKAYFRVLQDIDNLAYIGSTRTAYERQLDQVTEQYRVGLKTITDVYTARASYEAAVADYIGADATLASDRENLRAITGNYYPLLARLQDDFPLITPRPANIDDWVTQAGKQNWSIKSAQENAASKRSLIKKQFAGHLPSLSFAGSWDDQFSRTSSRDLTEQIGSARTETTTGTLNLTIPLVQGGFVIAQTHRAQYDYQAALQNLEQQLRSVLTQTRQSYMNIVAGISKIKADRQAIKSSISSLKGLEEGYRVGTQTLIDVLNQQRNVFLAEVQYANDRYAYVNNLLSLKQAAGTLGINDLRAINEWLSANNGLYGVEENTLIQEKTAGDTAFATKHTKIAHTTKHKKNNKLTSLVKKHKKTLSS